MQQPCLPDRCNALMRTDAVLSGIATAASVQQLGTTGVLVQQQSITLFALLCGSFTSTQSTRPLSEYAVVQFAGHLRSQCMECHPYNISNTSVRRAIWCEEQICRHSTRIFVAVLRQYLIVQQQQQQSSYQCCNGYLSNPLRKRETGSPHTIIIIFGYYMYTKNSITVLTPNFLIAPSVINPVA